MTFLVVGSGGQLGHDLCAELAGRDVVAVDRPEVDLTDAAAVRDLVTSVRPEVVVNAAAYTDVDAAESHEQLATVVNGHGAGFLAAACAEVPGTRLVHVSTDYVFAGDATVPYPEDAPMAPRSAYGRSKALGERLVRAALPDRAYVVRTAWLYGAHGTNFPRTMLRLEQERPDVSVVTDQIGQPTWSRDLAGRLVALVTSGAPAGIYHGTNGGAATWFDFAREVFRLAGANPDRVHPTTTADFPRPAPRPAFSVLAHDGWARAGLPPMRDWRAALQEAFPALVAAGS